MRSILVVILGSIAVAFPQKTFAFVPGIPTTSPSFKDAISTRLSMAIDYNDPLVAEEFANVQPMDFDEVEAELRAKGIPVPATIT